MARFKPALTTVQSGETERHWVERIRYALNNHDFYTVQQSIVDLEGENEGLFENRTYMREEDGDIPASEFMPAAEVRDAIARHVGGAIVPDDGSGVAGAGPASYWRVTQGPYTGRKLGTIAALTENFCSSCNRLRISTTGQLHGCLARDDTGDLRGALRSQEPGRVEEVVRQVLGTKRDAHGFNMDGTGGPQKAMISIGG